MTSPLLDPSQPLTRAAVRNAAVGLLDTLLPELGGRILRARAWPVQPETFPCALLYAMQERRTTVSPAGAPPDQDVELTLAVHLRVEASGPAGGSDEELVEAQLDALAARAQQALTQPSEWLACFSRIGDVTYAAEVKPGGDRMAGEAVITVALHWQELYQPPTYPLLRGFTATISDPGTNAAVTINETLS